MKKLIFISIICIFLFLVIGCTSNNTNYTQENSVSPVATVPDSTPIVQQPANNQVNEPPVVELVDNCTGKLFKVDIIELCSSNQTFEEEKITVLDPNDEFDKMRLDYSNALTICDLEIEGVEYYADNIVLAIYDYSAGDVRENYEKEYTAYEKDILENGESYEAFAGGSKMGDYHRTFEEVNLGERAFIFQNSANLNGGTELRTLTMNIQKGDKQIMLNTTEANQRQLCTKEELIEVAKRALSRIN